MDIAQISVNVDGQEVSVGGLVLNMVWDPSGERLVVSFKDSNFMALFCTKVTSTRLSITPLGFIQGEPDEFSSTMEFAQKFSGSYILNLFPKRVFSKYIVINIFFRWSPIINCMVQW